MPRINQLWVSLLVFVVVAITACTLADSRQDQPAVIFDSSAQSRASVQKVVSDALGMPVALADDVFADTSQLIIERQRHRNLNQGVLLGTDLSLRTEQFLLVINDQDCVLIRLATKARWLLPDVKCKAIKK